MRGVFRGGHGDPTGGMRPVCPAAARTGCDLVGRGAGRRRLRDRHRAGGGRAGVERFRRFGVLAHLREHDGLAAARAERQPARPGHRHRRRRGRPGPFAFSVPFGVGERQVGELEASEEDASDGEGFPPGRTVLPLVLCPEAASRDRCRVLGRAGGMSECLTTTCGTCADAWRSRPRRWRPATSRSARCWSAGTEDTRRGPQPRRRRRRDAPPGVRAGPLGGRQPDAGGAAPGDGLYLGRALPDVRRGARLGRPRAHRLRGLLGAARGVAGRARRRSAARAAAADPEVVPDAEVDGPAAELSEEVRALHVRFHA